MWMPMWMPMACSAGRWRAVARAGLALLAWALSAVSVDSRAEAPAPTESEVGVLVQKFASEVDRRLEVPLAERQAYIERLEQALAQAGAVPGSAQAYVLVDRSPQVQAAMLLVHAPPGSWHWIGATAVSTGKVGSFDHFRTPLGVFAHSLDPMDFRAEGSFNENHIRGYGLRGMRVFDFGWQTAERGWGDGGVSPMRLQMHATDPDVLEPRLGRAESKGCIRIPASLNTFLDVHGVLDADHEQALARGETLWVMLPRRDPIPWPGRYPVIVDSLMADRPAWSPPPGAVPARR